MATTTANSIVGSTEELSVSDAGKTHVDHLLERYGPMVGGQDLLKIAGFPNAAALRQAVRRKTVGFPVFLVPGRRGRFAWTVDVAQWLEGLVERQEFSQKQRLGGAT